jgi:hypothetical protein
MNDQSKLFSVFDVVLFSIFVCIFALIGLLHMWKMDNFWMLKIWFTWKVCKWVYELIQGMKTDVTETYTQPPKP